MAGFTYIGLLIAVVVLGVGLSAAGTLWRTQAQREREAELLYAGEEIRTAIGAYYSKGGHQYPQELSDLLEDKRSTEPKHYLRRLYADPMTGAPDWTLIRQGMLGITGVASSAKGEPIKKKGFADDEELFKDAKCYCDWQFAYHPVWGRRRTGTAPAPVEE